MTSSALSLSHTIIRKPAANYLFIEVTVFWCIISSDQVLYNFLCPQAQIPQVVCSQPLKARFCYYFQKVNFFSVVEFGLNFACPANVRSAEGSALVEFNR